ncbi:MAG: sugar phosphate isomerase/epimerase [Clostridia bacterium]|nr:sugar phosphate isomerase/epimerase [Clostridia bacterium]MBO5298872.1 sugar phosphate isomerase/epimerase [Clostridia bacterium]
MFKIGIMADSLKLGFRESIEKARELGAQGVQIYATEGEMAPENLTPALIAEKRDIILSNGLCVSALCGDLGGHGFERTEENKDKIERSKRIVDLALELGSKVVTTHIGVVPDTKNDTYNIMQQACNELAEYADSVGASFAVETGPEKATMLKEFLDGLSARGVKVNLDPANLVMVTGDDPVQAVYTLKDYIIHTHAKDGIKLKESDRHEVYGFFADGGIGDLRIWEYFSEVPLGQGKVDFDRYLAALKDIGYDGFLTIEREVGEDPAADIKLAVDFLKSKIG